MTWAVDSNDPRNFPEAPAEPYRGPVKYKIKRDYSHGSIRDAIRNADTVEELESIRQFVLELRRSGRLAARTAKKIDVAGANKAKELNNQLLIKPNTKLVVPRGLQSTSGGLIVLP